MRDTRRWRRRGAALVVVLAVACLAAPAAAKRGKHKRSKAPAAEQQQAEALPARAVPVDASLTVAEYIDLGIPAHDRVWSSADLTRAAGALQTLAASRPGALPRWQSERSGALFARLTSWENIEVAAGAELAPETHVGMALEWMESSNIVLQTYLLAYTRGAAGGDELVELFGLQLAATEQVLAGVAAFVPTLDPADPTYENRLAGLDQMRGGLGEIVSGVMTAITDTGALDPAAQRRLAGYMLATFPAIVPELRPTGIQETRVRLGQLVVDPALAGARAEIEAVAASVDDALAASADVQGD